MLNACELEIDLFCKGLRVPAGVPLTGARSVSRTRAGLGSGLELALPAKSWLKDEIWVNAPVVERFAAASPYRLDHDPGIGHLIVDDRSGTRYRVRLPAEPEWYGWTTAGQNVGASEARDKFVADVVETCRAARGYSGVTFVHLNGYRPRSEEVAAATALLHRSKTGSLSTHRGVRSVQARAWPSDA